MRGASTASTTEPASATPPPASSAETRLGAPRDDHGAREPPAGAGEQCGAPVRLALPAEDSGRDREHERRLDALAQRDDESLEHAGYSPPPGRTSASGASAVFHAWHTRGEQNPNAASFNV